MPRSDNDGGSLSSSGNGCSSPVTVSKMPHRTPTDRIVATAATVGKGILVHKNKKSANTNRVSFKTKSSSLTPSPPSGKRFKNKKNSIQFQLDDDDKAPFYARTGRRLTGFGVKSHLHEFYDDPNNRKSFQGDDFKYLVEPKFQWHRHCCSPYALLGLFIMAAGAVAMAVGHLIPAKNPLVGRSANMEVIDRWAIEFNRNLASCRLIGSAVFAIGVVFTVFRFWISVIRSDSGSDMKAAAEKKLAGDDERPSMSTVRSPATVGPPPPTPLPPQKAQSVRIPITGFVEAVQPDPKTIDLQFSNSN